MDNTAPGRGGAFLFRRSIHPIRAPTRCGFVVPAIGLTVELPPSSAMNQYRDLTMREDLDCFAAENDRGDAVATVRGHDDQITAFRLRCFYDCPIGILMLDMNQVAGDGAMGGSW
jgi:hypothetical protein